MKPLLDMNVVLDVLLTRQPWFEDAAKVWDANRNGAIVAAVAAFSLPTIFYIVRRHIDMARGFAAVQTCLTSFEIIKVDRSTLELAGTLGGNDFEDNLQLACAIEGQRDCLVTRDPGGFRLAAVPVLTPADFLARLGQTS